MSAQMQSDVVVDVRESGFQAWIALGTGLVTCATGWQWMSGVIRTLLVIIWAAYGALCAWKLAHRRHVSVSATELHIGDASWPLADIAAVYVRRASWRASRSIAVQICGCSDPVVLPELSERDTTLVANTLQQALDRAP